MKYMHRIRIIRSLCTFAFVWMVHTLCICVCMCVSFGIRDAPGGSSLRLETSGVARQCRGLGEGEEQGGHGGCYGHQANCIQVEDHQEPACPDGQDETTRKIGNAGLDAVHSYASSMSRCYPARAHTHTTSTRRKQIRETTTGEDK